MPAMGYHVNGTFVIFCPRKVFPIPAIAASTQKQQRNKTASSRKPGQSHPPGAATDASVKYGFTM
jgi:hypothetical protein